VSLVSGAGIPRHGSYEPQPSRPFSLVACEADGNEWNMPKPLPGAEWQLDTKFNMAEELLRDPELKAVLKAALENGSELVIQNLGLKGFK
jgi:hypothetical protein